MIVVGHRGAAGHAPENTMRSIRTAIDLGVDWIEIDVQRTADSELVLFHDKLVDRVTEGTGYLERLTYRDVEGLRVHRSERVPRLEEVCEAVASSRARLMVEIISQGIEGATLSLLRRSLDPGRFLIASFHHGILLRVKEQAPDVETLALLEGSPVDPLRLLEDSRCDYVGLGFESIDPRHVDLLRGAGRPVLVWTVNDPREIRRAASLGVDGIISDYPERVRDHV